MKLFVSIFAVIASLVKCDFEKEDGVLVLGEDNFVDQRNRA